ncbi:MAG TPA: four helix bundle protein [Verrucomicrobiae bacterium]|jgi:four helix bundle protein|nr:four helix bundle protein [Verrucomicrobiae bacterium]
MQNGPEKKRRPPPEILDRTFAFAVRIVKLCDGLDERRGVPRILMPQILRAGTSIVSNLEEAQSGQSRADFISKMAIALKEAREVHVGLRILAQAGVIPVQKLDPLLLEAEEIKRVLASIIIATKNGRSHQDRETRNF